jgi:hypothetical protein
MDEYFYKKQAIGQRFKQFRELLGISRKEAALLFKIFTHGLH